MSQALLTEARDPLVSRFKTAQQKRPLANVPETLLTNGPRAMNTPSDKNVHHDFFCWGVFGAKQTLTVEKAIAKIKPPQQNAHIYLRLLSF